MTPDLATFRAIFPEWASIADGVVDVYIESSLDDLSESAWGNCYGKAVLYYAAHELSLSQARQAAATTTSSGTVVPQTGVLQSGSEEGISFAFAASGGPKNATQEWLGQSPYGQAFMALQRQCLSRGVLSW